MDEMPSEAQAGRLLVATPVLGDPNFRRTVVLIVEHEVEQGTLGVVLNRPTQVPVGQVLESWTELATDPSVVFNGGPVAPTSALALAHLRGGARSFWRVHRRPGRPARRAPPRAGAGPRGAGRLASAGRRARHGPARPG